MRLRKAKQRTRGTLGRSWREYCRRLPIVKNKIFLESYAGNGLTCSPEALFRYLAKHQRDHGFTFVWVVRDTSEFADQITELQRLAPFDVVKRGTREYYRHLYTSHFLINNMSFASDFVKRKGQIYLNTWHGTPLKKMGFDVTGHIQDGKNVLRNFLSADYLLSSSTPMTERMYLEAFKLTNVFEGTILEEGLPRTDLQHDRQAVRSELSRRWPHLGLEADHRKIVLYAPTWRGSDYESPDAAAELMRGALETMQDVLDSGSYRIMVKPHQAIAKLLTQDDLLAGVSLVPSEANANLALGLADVLVTDYSSIFYDFLPTGRPIIHYAPDLVSYAEDRDVYDPPAEWPGDVASNDIEFRQALLAVTSAGWTASDEYTESAEAWAPNEDGSVCQRVVDVVFFGAESERANEAPSDGREKMVIYVGPLIRNGITSAAMNLLANIDHDRYDVTALVPFNAHDHERLEQANSIDSRVRVMFRFGSFTGSPLENWYRILRFNIDGVRLGKSSAGRTKLWRQEWHRIFGEAYFDHLIDFTGYSPFWGALFIAGDGGTRVIWQHNDLAADAQRKVNGHRHLYTGLSKVFQLYPWFDRIVSVSEPLMRINREALGTAVTTERFDWVPNTLDEFSLAATRTAIDRIARQEVFTFINVGRMSPEKNQSRLLQAFSVVAKTKANARLKLLGDGPLRGKLEQEAALLGVAERVEFCGLVADPYPTMRLSDCMVVSSDYEGQPMVILEAMALGLPVITTAFGSVGGAFPHGGGVVVSNDVAELAEAMNSAIDDGIVPSNFQAKTYNSDTMQRFYKILGGQAAPASLGREAGKRNDQSLACQANKVKEDI